MVSSCLPRSTPSPGQGQSGRPVWDTVWAKLTAGPAASWAAVWRKRTLSHGKFSQIPRLFELSFDLIGAQLRLVKGHFNYVKSAAGVERLDARQRGQNAPHLHDVVITIHGGKLKMGLLHSCLLG